MNSLIEMFSYSFMVRAFIVGGLIALCSALIGVPLVLRKNSMIGDGLSHVAFGAFAIATVLGFAPVEFALPVVILASFFILRLSENSKIHGDSAIAIVSASALAIGTFAISVTKGVNIDLNSYLFGSILSLSNSDVIISIILSITVLALYILSYHKIFAITFDQRFAQSIGVRVGIYNAIFAILCSVVVVLGMRLMGALLISSLIIFPTLSSSQIFKNFKSVVISGALISVISFILGLIISYFYSTPTSSTIVLVNLIALLLAKLSSGIKNT